MQNKIYPCIMCDDYAAEAGKFYSTVFKDSSFQSGHPLVTMVTIQGQKIMLLNGGPSFTKNPSISFMVLCDSPEEVREYWQNLSQDAKVMMELNSYPWSEQYGWLEDKYGVSWQLYSGEKGEAKEKVVPTLMFTGGQDGKAREAIHYYTSLFPNSRIQGIMEYGEGQESMAGNVQHAQFDIDGFTLMAMDGGKSHDFTFSEGVSLVINCDDQQEIDKYWNTLTADGGSESQCGWLKDRFGVSWQVVPSMMGELLGNPEKAQRVMAEVMKMKKLDIDVLKNA